MKIGIDISSLQGAHRMRGIGYTTINFIQNIPKLTKDYFVFYVCEEENGYDISPILTNLNIPKPNFDIQTFDRTAWTKYLPGRLRYINKAFQKIKNYANYIVGDTKYPNLKSLDAFIQLDQSMPLPRLKQSAKNYFIAYDLIPYVLESDYLPGYRTSRHQGRSRKSALKATINRFTYIKKIKINSRRAHKILSISQTTKRDFIEYAKIPGHKIDVITLGVDSKNHEGNNSDSWKVDRYFDTSWGYIPKQENLSSKSFLLFVGGADERRRLDDLVAAFNNLKAQGSNLKLVLSGDIMQGPKNIPSISIRESLETSSYKNDIYFLGFTDDTTRNWLYKNAVAFVFPSIYEGFGLPVLEAMSLKTPVICYKNKAIYEIASDTPFYTQDTLGLIREIKKVQLLSKTKKLKNILDKGFAHAERHTWKNTTETILAIISKDYRE